LAWDRVNCLYRNGDISGYRIEYGITSFAHSMTIHGTNDSLRAFTATSLTPDTYKLRVAAVNSNGIGPYSSETMQQIPRGKYV